MNFKRDEKDDRVWHVTADKGAKVATLRVNPTKNVERKGKWYHRAAVFVSPVIEMMPLSTVEMLTYGAKQLAEAQISYDDDYFYVDYQMTFSIYQEMGMDE
jgi:hypothetical protein